MADDDIYEWLCQGLITLIVVIDEAGRRLRGARIYLEERDEGRARGDLIRRTMSQR
jgi:hypothetical protein